MIKAGGRNGRILLTDGDKERSELLFWCMIKAGACP